MKLYSNTAVENLQQKYHEQGGNCLQVQDGSLLEYGLGIFYGNGLKTCIVQEQYLNEWSSAYRIRFYNKIPKKYQRLIENS
jgi:hypothetical protein